MDKYKYDAKLLAKEVKIQRIIELGVDFRALSSIIGISTSTLCRVENEGMPDLITYATICKWLKRPLDYFIKKVK